MTTTIPESLAEQIIAEKIKEWEAKKARAAAAKDSEEDTVHPFLAVIRDFGCAEEEIILSPGGRIAGVVVDAAGSPIDDAQVWISPLDQRDMRSFRRSDGRSAMTDEAGAFDLDGTAAPMRYRLSVRKEGFANGVHGPIELDPGSDLSDFTIVLTEGATIAVRLIDADQKPVSEIALRLDQAPESTRRDLLDTTQRGDVGWSDGRRNRCADYLNSKRSPVAASSTATCR